MADYRIYEKYRNDKGLKDYAVAKATGIAQSTLTDWKNGRYEPKISKLEKIAKYLGITVDELKGIEHDTKTQEIKIPEKRITESERYLLDAFRNADALHQEMVLEILGIREKEMVKNA